MDTDTTKELHFVEQLSEDLLDTYLLVALGARTTGDGIATQCFAKENVVALIGNPKLSPFLRSFCREWEMGGRIIELFQIDLKHEENEWHASFKGVVSFGVTPLIAAVRVLLKYSLEENKLLLGLPGEFDLARRIFGISPIG
jgi:hypothetical protein|nr:hypothetical protein [uncultured Undibacterium sp.]